MNAQDQNLHSLFRVYVSLLLLTLLFLTSTRVSAQEFPCDGRLYFTRQMTGGTRVSAVTVSGTSTVNVANVATISNSNTNATVYYNGYVYTQAWSVNSTNQTTFTLLRSNYAGQYTTKTIPTSLIPNAQYNNAGVDKNGIMYILATTVTGSGSSATVKLYKIDLKQWAGAGSELTATSVDCAMPNASGVIWGDIAFNPITGKAYAWYHPSSTPSGSQPTRGLYEIQNITSASPSIVKVGNTANYTMGSLFFDERGRMFGYGVTAGGGDQKYFYNVNLSNGQPSQIGESEVSAQSDGCECMYRLSLTLTGGDNGNGTVDIPSCSTPANFNFQFTATNTASGSFSGITFDFPLDSRFSFVASATTLKTFFDTQFPGSNSVVTLSGINGGTNNHLYVTGIFVKGTSESGGNAVVTTFGVDVKIADASAIANNEKVQFQANIGGLTAYYGTTEGSSDPLLFGKQATQLTFLRTDDCNKSISGTVYNDPDGPANGVGGTVMEGIVVTIYLADGTTQVATTTTNAQGIYSFANLPAGNYVVKVTEPSGYAHVSSTDVAGSQADGSTPVTLGTSNIGNVNFGLQHRPSAYSVNREVTGAPTPDIAIPLTNMPLQGSDPEDQNNQSDWTSTNNGGKLIITSLPSGDDGNPNGFELSYNSHIITAADIAAGGYVIENYNPSLLVLTPRTPAGNVTKTTFKYKTMDSFGAESNEASAVITFTQALPVVFGAIDATFSNGVLNVTWQSLTEENNSHYDIQVSENGVDFVTIGSVKSKTEDGNSSLPINYTFSKSVNEIALGIAVLAMAGGLGFRRRKLASYVLLSMGLTAAIYSCTKERADLVDNKESKLFVRIAQVDKDGSKSYSQVIIAVKK
ncbi:SdrD B-like domain-containing protein [Niabella aquatica]